MVQKSNITKEDIESVAKLYGAKLAFLLYATTLSEEKKQAWITLLPQMSLSQIERLVDILEQQYADQETQDIDEKFKKELEKIKKDYDKKNKNSQKNK